jgi:hypothetical protein
MATRTKKTRRRRPDLTPIEEAIADVRARAAAVGLRLSGDKFTATLPAVRCTQDERERVERMAGAEGISLAEHIRRRSVADPPGEAS